MRRTRHARLAGPERLEPRWLLSADSSASGSVEVGPLVPIGTRTEVHGLDPADGSSTTRTASPLVLSTSGALTLPRHRLVRVDDTLGLDRTTRVYRIPIDDATESVGIELRADGSGAALREAMTLTDESGHELASCTPPPGGRSLWIGLPPAHLRVLRARGAALYLTISVPAEALHDRYGDEAIDPGQPAEASGTTESTTDAPGLGFVLVVQRVDVEPDTATAGDPTSLVLDPGPWSDRVDMSTAPVATVSEPRRMASGNDATAQPQTLVRTRPAKAAMVPTGTLPRRATGPLGGILAADGGETVADRSDPARIDLALIDLSDSPDGDDTASDDDDPVVPADVGPRDDAVIAVRGPGGVPLFGASLMTESRSRRPWDLADLPIIAAVPATVAGPAAIDPARRGRDAGRRAAGRRVTSLVALTAAGMMAAHLGLPDLTDPLRRWSRPPR